MSNPNDPVWQQFADLGMPEVRKRLALRIWGERNEDLARQWLVMQEAHAESSDRQAVLGEARSANDLAREANSFARSANSFAEAANSTADRAAKAAEAAAAANVDIADATRKSNTIATIALIVAVIAIALSILVAFVKK